MKIVETISSLYNYHYDYMCILQNHVDKFFLENKNKLWHYVSRVKSIESFALKMETGRFSPDRNLEDFFACTLVVENLSQIQNAIHLIEKTCNIEYRRPKDSSKTHKEPHSFQFDDLRLYVKLKKEEYKEDSLIFDIIFEIQIKTFLQYAWVIATHDLIYKSGSISWPKERVAFQIKAMLEHAELSIKGAEDLANLEEIAKEDRNSSELKKILEIYSTHFHKDMLPKDILRLCGNTSELLRNVGIETEELNEVLRIEASAGRGSNIENLSPYLIIIQSLISQKREHIENYINGRPKKFKIVLPKELPVSSLNITKEDNIVRM